MSLKTFGWIDLVLGVLLVALGLYTLFNPLTALYGIVIVFGIAAIISGISDIVMYRRIGKRVGFAPGMLIVSAVINLLIGVLLLFNIGAGAWTLSILFPLWFFVHCVGRLLNLGFIRRFETKAHYWYTLIINVLGLIAAVMLVFRPFLSGSILSIVVGIYLLLSGITCIWDGISALRS